MRFWAYGPDRQRHRECREPRAFGRDHRRSQPPAEACAAGSDCPALGRSVAGGGDCPTSRRQSAIGLALRTRCQNFAGAPGERKAVAETLATAAEKVIAAATETLLPPAPPPRPPGRPPALRADGTRVHVPRGRSPAEFGYVQVKYGWGRPAWVHAVTGERLNKPAEQKAPTHGST